MRKVTLFFVLYKHKFNQSDVRILVSEQTTHFGLKMTQNSQVGIVWYHSSCHTFEICRSGADITMRVRISIKYIATSIKK